MCAGANTGIPPTQDFCVSDCQHCIPYQERRYYTQRPTHSQPHPPTHPAQRCASLLLCSPAAATPILPLSGSDNTATAPADRYARAAAAAVFACSSGSSSGSQWQHYGRCLMPCSLFLSLLYLILSLMEGSHPISTASYVRTCRHVGK
jgi:hypothetical protein